LPAPEYPDPEFPTAALCNGGGRNLSETVAETEKQMLIEALEQTNWNMTRAAEALGITFRSMRYNVKKYGLSRDESEFAAGATR
jgi:two-component system, NtrC family, response regulator PilR